MDLSLYVQDNLNTITVVVFLQVLCHYEFMLEVGLLMTGNQLYKSQSCVASPHLTRLGEGALQLVVSEPRFRRFWISHKLEMHVYSNVLA